MKVAIQHAIVVELHAVGTVEFKEDFLDRVKSSLRAIGQEFKVLELNLELGGKAIVVEAKGLPLASIAEFKDAVVRQVILLAEHGPDADLLGVLLDRHPELRGHPSLSSLVRSFENMTAVLDGILGDERSSVAAEVQRRAVNGITLVEGDLEATQSSRKRTMSVSDRALFREAAILGQTPEQVAAARISTNKDVSVLPDVYRKVAKRAAVDPEAVGDGGNVFTRPAKGSTT